MIFKILFSKRKILIAYAFAGFLNLCQSLYGFGASFDDLLDMSKKIGVGPALQCYNKLIGLDTGKFLFTKSHVKNTSSE